MTYSDKLHNAIERFYEAETVVNNMPGPIDKSPEEATFHAAIDNIGSGKHVASTAPGALAALHLLQKEAQDFAGSDMSKALIDGAMAYLKPLEEKNGSCLLDAIRLVDDMPSVTEIAGTGFVAIYDALSCCIETLGGISQQPRCSTRGGLNAAGEYLHALADFMLYERRRIMTAAAEFSEPEHNSDTEARLRAVLIFKADDNDCSVEQMEQAIALLDARAGGSTNG